MELEVALAAIVRSFRLEFPRDEPIDVVSRLVLDPVTKSTITFHPRT